MKAIDENTTGLVFDIEEFAVFDGPGIRCAVFLHGCALRCKFCHNPDTWDFTGGTQTTAEELVGRILRYRNYFGERGGVTVSGGEPLMQSEFLLELLKGAKEAGLHTCIETCGYTGKENWQKILDTFDFIIMLLKGA